MLLGAGQLRPQIVFIFVLFLQLLEFARLDFKLVILLNNQARFNVYIAKKYQQRLFKAIPVLALQVLPDDWVQFVDHGQILVEIVHVLLALERL